jgi:hypothetical protein
MKSNSVLILFFFIIGVRPILFAQLNDMAILSIIEKHKPLKGAKIPGTIRDMLGATHVDGKYYFTNKPFLVEGSRQINELGLGVCKLWFYKNQTGYRYNTDSSLSYPGTLREMAEMAMYKEVFSLPFSTIVLSTSANQARMSEPDSAGLARESWEYYELTRYLLRQYHNREIRFVLQNWEGDWIVRGGTGWNAQWGRVDPPADADKRFRGMQEVFKARQAGVNRARNEVPDAICRVYHAIEVNKVIDAMYGVPSVATHVLPFVEVDMVSWSAYDATDYDKTGLDLYKGITFLKGRLRPTVYMKEKVVFLGEIGIPEMTTKNLPSEFRERWDNYVAVCLALNVPFIIQWGLYCNEPANGKKINFPDTAKTNQDMNGFWLIRKDGSKSYVMKYFEELLQHAGGYIVNQAADHVP